MKREKPMRILKYSIAVLLAGVLLVSCTLKGESQTREPHGQSGVSESGPEKRSLKILTSSKIIADMIQSLSGEHTVNYLAQSEAQMNQILPEPDMVSEGSYDAFYYIGAGYEPFIREFTGGIDKNRVSVVNISRGIDILRHKINKIDIENYYYLTNSTNFKIALNSIKNSLQEMDSGSKVEYDEGFVAMSARIDDFKKQVRQFTEENDQLVFLADSDWVAYVAADYHADYQLISDYAERKTSEAAANTTTAMAPSNTASLTDPEKRIFLYSEDLSLQKYADDIVKFSLIPVKIDLYSGEGSIVDSFQTHFDKIREAVQPKP